ncbi:hypothetical protein TNCV_4178421 [Trichonephila clavipes]|nr:hypothetical protein TNCV_4178421 [Trichonephila clavipes]
MIRHGNIMGVLRNLKNSFRSVMRSRQCLSVDAYIDEFRHNFGLTSIHQTCHTGIHQTLHTGIHIDIHHFLTGFASKQCLMDVSSLMPLICCLTLISPITMIFLIPSLCWT